jgi:hypothetical protein
MPTRAFIKSRGFEPKLEVSIFDVYETICRAIELNAEIDDLLTRRVLFAVLEVVDAGETEAPKILREVIARLGISCCKPSLKWP